MNFSSCNVEHKIFSDGHRPVFESLQNASLFACVEATKCQDDAFFDADVIVDATSDSVSKCTIGNLLVDNLRVPFDLDSGAIFRFGESIWNCYKAFGCPEEAASDAEDGNNFHVTIGAVVGSVGTAIGIAALVYKYYRNCKLVCESCPDRKDKDNSGEHELAKRDDKKGSGEVVEQLLEKSRSSEGPSVTINIGAVSLVKSDKDIQQENTVTTTSM